jgi:hypothetical protein
MEANPGDVKVLHRNLRSHSGDTHDHLGTTEANPGAITVQSGVLEATLALKALGSRYRTSEAILERLRPILELQSLILEQMVSLEAHITVKAFQKGLAPKARH